MAKRIHHMGKVITRAEHDDFHQHAPDLSPQQHAALMKRMGISQEQDQEWHRTHLTLREQREQGLMHVEAAAVGGAFVAWCVKQGWLVARGEEHFATKEGMSELRTRFGIAVERSRRR